MNVKSFSVATTNLFPATNTTKGGQLVTEFNLRSINSVSGPENVQYMNGPSYTHGEKDYYVSTAQSASNTSFFDSTASGGTVITIHPGRAVVNGFYVENLVPMVVDLAELNAQAVADGNTPINGKLAIGLKVMLSTETTMLGSILTEDENDEYYEGIQLVIVPESEVRLPTTVYTDGDDVIDCGTVENQWRVNMDILLGTFNYINGGISNVINNYPAKCQSMPASRIGSIDDIIPETYVKKSGLNPKRIYTFAGKGTDPSTGDSTWCDSTDALMIWDNNPKFTSDLPSYTEATFAIMDDSPNAVKLILPHKQIDGMTDAQGNPQYYAPKIISIPNADWGMGTPGMVTKAYTESVKAINNKMSNFYQLTNGKQRAFLNELTDVSDLPNLDPSWNVGDYVLVAKDSTIISELNDTLNLTPPSTMYVVLPGVVTAIGEAQATAPTGVCLDTYVEPYETDTQYNQASNRNWWDISSGAYRGNVGVDYFTLKLEKSTGDYVYCYYPVTETNELKTYSPPIQLTGQYPFATEEMTGGFLNAPDSYVDAGYVYLDDYGHLRLRDYALLRSGTLAYQLGADYTIDAGLTIDEIQAELNEYINQRIAFPTLQQIYNSNPNVITINITLPEEIEGETPTLNISGIDSRFNTAVCINIYGVATNITTINISDCEKIKIVVAEGTPTVNLYRSCLYYDANTLTILNEIVDMSLWYEKMQSTDPDIVVEGMTVRAVADTDTYYSDEADYTVVSSEFWTTDAPNDNHFMVALQSITFGSNGIITGCSVLVRNDSTSNVTEGRAVFHDTSFVLPQGPALYYPVTRLNQAIKVTGRFISAYEISNPDGYMVQETDFSLSTPYYNTLGQVKGNGEVAFLTNAYSMTVADPETITVWEPNSFHHFSGTTLL